MEFSELISTVTERISKNKRVRRTLPGGGRLRLDRQLPFLCVYRQPPDREDKEAKSLVTTEAAYLFASGAAAHQAGLTHLCRTLIERLHEHFGAFLLVELWTTPGGEVVSPAIVDPKFHIHLTPDHHLSQMAETLQLALQDIRLHGTEPVVQFQNDWQEAPPGLEPLAKTGDPGLPGFAHLGLEIQPMFRSVNGTIFPMLLQSLQRQLGPALRKAVYAFTGSNPDRQPPSYLSFGPTSMVKAARMVDQQLSDISQSFDFILQATPVNAVQAWRKFAAAKYERVIRFRYRPLPYHPSILKRQLFQIPIERVEDVSLAHLFWEKQEELDRQLTALRDLNTPAFHYCSLQLYKKPTHELVELAQNILNSAPARREVPGERKSKQRKQARGRFATAQEIADQARLEIDYYHQRLPSFAGTVHMNDQIASGIMVAKEQLLITPSLRIPRRRVLPLLHHEIGTHLLTYYNGRTQPLKQLYAGLAGYDSLQEGLAVLAEHLTGGLSPSRLRHLAARVLAVQARIHGATFIDTFRLLHRQHEISAKVAFNTTLRAHRGGGLTKDAIYLLGLKELLGYLAQGHDLEPLYVGKIALSHIPIIQELRLRGIVQPPALLPRFWNGENEARSRLEYCRNLTVMEMLTQPPTDFYSPAQARDDLPSATKYEK